MMDSLGFTTGIVTIFVLISASLSVPINDDAGLHTVDSKVSADKVYQGDDVTFECRAVMAPGAEDVTVVAWKKRLEENDGNTVTSEIAVNSIVEPAFFNLGRYEAALADAGDWDSADAERTLIATLTIKNAQPEDTGLIVCEFTDIDMSLDQDLTVITNISAVKITTYDADGAELAVETSGQDLTFSEDEIRKIYCHVTGAYPEPTVKMFKDGKDITSQFTHESVRKMEGAEGLQALSYDVWLKNEAMTIDYEFSKKSLECKAQIPDVGLPEVTQSFTVHLSGYTPKFSCEEEFSVNLDAENYEVICPVFADPPAADFKIFWDNEPVETVETNTNSTNSTESPAEKHFNVKFDQGETEFETKMILQISKVADKHFGTYHFEALNELGKSKHMITLLNKGGNEVTTKGPLIVTTEAEVAAKITDHGGAMSVVVATSTMLLSVVALTLAL